MTRDDDLIRLIMLQVAKTPPNEDPEVQIPDRDENQVLEHLELLIDAGFLEGKTILSGLGGERILAVHIERMTWAGQEFVALTANEQVWERTKVIVRERGGSVSFEILRALLAQTAQELFLGPQ